MGLNVLEAIADGTIEMEAYTDGEYRVVVVTDADGAILAQQRISAALSERAFSLALAGFLASVPLDKTV